MKRQSTNQDKPGEEPPSAIEKIAMRRQSRMSNTERSSEDTKDKSRTTSKGNERRRSQIRSENTKTGDKQSDGAGDKRIASLSLSKILKR